MNALTKTLVLAVVAELGTGLALLYDPAFVSDWLLGLAISQDGSLFARLFGLAILALCLACWPGIGQTRCNSAAFRTMLFYNATVAVYIAYIGVFVSSGLLLWPALIFHVAVTVLLLRSWRTERQARLSNN
jgi:hypothetical protein